MKSSSHKNLSKRSFDSQFIQQMKKKRRKGAFVWILRSVVFSCILCCLITPQLKTLVILDVSPLLFVSDLPDVLKALANNLYTLHHWFLLSPVLILLCCCFIKRFFCRFICPLGLIVDVFALFRKKFFTKRLLRYGLIFNTNNLASFFTVFWACCIWVKFSSFPFIDLFPSPLAFDPLAIISRTITSLAHSIVLLAILFLGFCLSPMLWRFQICPCGLFQEILFLPKRLIKKIYTRKDSSNNVSSTEKFLLQTKNSLRDVATRRSFLGFFSSLFLFGSAFAYLKKLPKHIFPPTFLPPGSLKKELFSLKCSRCGNCVRKCPTEILLFPNIDTKSSSLSLVPQTPIVDFTKGKGYCASECVQCGQVCPTGAIRKINAHEKFKYPIARLQIDIQHCMLYYDQECSICRRECPYDAIDIVWSEEEYLSLPVVDSVRCVGCGRCVLSCPGEPIWQETTSPPLNSPKALSLIQVEN